MKKRLFVISLVIFALAVINPSFAAPKKPATNPAQGASAPKENWKPDILRRQTPQPLKVYVLDVGQGDSIFIEFPYGETMLIDAGSQDSYGAGHLKQFLNDYFKKNPYKNKTIDVIVASHPDYDHIRWIRDIISNYKVNWYLDDGMPGTTGIYLDLMNTIKSFDKKNKLDYVAITEKDPSFEKDGFLNLNSLIPFKDATVDILGSYVGSGKEDVNNASIVMKVIHGNTSMLLTGDSEGNNVLDKAKYSDVKVEDYEENRIYKRLATKNKLNLLDSDVLKVGHHGSEFSATEVYLSEVAPEVSVVSVGNYNVSSKSIGFGHPRLVTLQRLDKYTSRKDKEQKLTAYDDKKTLTDFTTDKAIYLTATGNNLKKIMGVRFIKKYGDIILELNGNKVDVVY